MPNFSQKGLNGAPTTSEKLCWKTKQNQTNGELHKVNTIAEMKLQMTISWLKRKEKTIVENVEMNFTIALIGLFWPVFTLKKR